MAFRRRRFFASTRKRARWVWTRHCEQLTIATPTNVDLLNYYKTVAGITIILPEITIWRVHIKISIKVTLSAAVVAADGVLVSCFVDGQTQAQLNSFSDPLAQQHLLYHWLPVSHVPAEGGGSTAGTYYLEHEFDIKSHRRIAKPEDTLFLQLAGTGGSTTVNDAFVTYAVLMRNPK
jgi:hypothetical protein